MSEKGRESERAREKNVYLCMQVTHVPLCVHQLTMIFRASTKYKFTHFNLFCLSLVARRLFGKLEINRPAKRNSPAQMARSAVKNTECKKCNTFELAFSEFSNEA